MSTYTPMIQQYLAVKKQAEDAFLFFRLGDFYELFFDDALLASKELEITLTGRGGGTEEKIPMCGVPYHAAENYIQRLIEKGYKVAICEQVEDPAAAKGVVRREIVRIVTPGTVMEGKSIDEKSNRYLIGITELNGKHALAACDLTTGELLVSSAPKGTGWLMDELNVYAPNEMIGDEALLAEVKPLTSAWNRNVLFTAWPERDDLLARQQFGESVWGRLEIERQHVISMMMAYLKTTQKRSLGQLTTIRELEPDQYLVLDPFTRRNLELTETVRERAKKGSLLWLLDKTETSMGGRLLRRWIDKPLLNRTSIEERLEAVNTLYHQLIWREELREQLSAIYDLERLVARIAFGTANGRDLISMKLSLERVPQLKELCLNMSSATLQQLANQMDACQDIAQWIEQAIIEEPPVSTREGNLIKTGYDAHLDKLREASVNGKRWIAELERKEREATGIKSLKIGYNKVFGYYIEVTKSNLAALPEGRYERKQTLANAERYVTPELKEKEALILEAEDKMVGLEYELFSELRQRINDHIRRLQTLAEALAEMDVYQSLATVSAKRRFVKPTLHDGYDLDVTNGRHPVVEAVMQQGSFMANDTALHEQESSMLLITGPNMAGKSTYMRQVALICIMAQIGCFVPADVASVPLVDRIFTRIGAADDLIGGQSTFMVEMMDIQVMTEKATRRSLVVIDELGRGTSTSEGMSIAQAVIEYVHHRIGCKALVSTHFHELAHLEDRLTRLTNVCMAVQENGNDVTFLRKLIPGAASTSYGIYCARLAGLPDTIITRAYDLLTNYEGEAVQVSDPDTTHPSSAEREGESKLVQLSLFGEETGIQSASPNIHADKKDKSEDLSAARLQAAATAEADNAVGDKQVPFTPNQGFGDGEHPVAMKEMSMEQTDPRTEQALKLLEALQEVDVMSMTPLEAMNQLHELMRSARKMKY
ncbi:DNA mismatch repair protein MutS [Paenibacillus sp. UMB4589-SE434]|uniref:DNA mismatch repair protein MutS n=1 Tax=Paenibacillus sp. UMB4589-SE434 TaxID=3046314 RepID=UPI00254AD833|nr:DNA mismatch repair protein MutS [Paenibacillus sp. UMB4589-SE434]MDK8179738.1 DNA mismatch repair protein MutS [Paenibacillus sp. UMB4589-SE434]